MGLFSQFWVPLSDVPRAGHEAVNAWRRGEAIFNFKPSCSRARPRPTIVLFAARRQIDTECCACGDMECGFDATDQRAAIRRQQSHRELRLVRGRGYASKTAASIRRRLDLRDIGPEIRRSDHENRTG